MILVADLRASARSYLAAARLLNRKGRGKPDTAVYLCGYAVEIALKARICRTLAWPVYPDTAAEFRSYQSFRTHDLNVLLHLAGQRTEDRIKQDPTAPVFADWSVVAEWNPEQRYRPVGTRTAADAGRMIEATARLLRMLL